MKSIEKSAKTIDDAIELALKELKLEKNQVEITILEQPAKGLFGIFGSKNALIRAEEVYSPSNEAKNFLETIFESMKLTPVTSIIENDDTISIKLTGDELGILIGRRGDTLDSLQFLVNLVVNKNSDKRIKVILDIENYRARREETLLNLANRLSEKAKRTSKKIVLEPMNPNERRLIHMALQDDKNINTYSEGEEPYRKVVIVPKR